MSTVVPDIFSLDAGHHPLILQGEVGKIEAILSVPENPSKQRLALVAHPHPLHGGTMNNKVVTSLVRALNDCGIAALRFNFRGVSGSEGSFDKGIGESLDVLKLLSDLQNKLGEIEILLLGFSFGAYVMYRVAAQRDTHLLITVAPAVNHGDFSEFESVPNPWYVLVAGGDEIVPCSEVMSWYESVSPKPTLKLFDEASHFFHGRLVELKETIRDILQHG